MSKIKSIFMNMSWLMASQIITSVLAFIWTILIARYLGVSDYGVFGFAISFTGIFVVICDCGTTLHIVRAVATDYDVAKDYLGNVLPLKFIMSFVYFAFILALLVVLNFSGLAIFITLLYAIETAIKNFNDLFYGVFQAHEKGKYQAMSSILSSVLSFILILSAIYFDTGLFGITIAYLVSYFMSFLYSAYILVTRIVVPKIQFDFKFWKQLLIWGAPFALTSIFYTVYYYMDIVMLTKMVGDFATGIYNASYKLISVLALFYGIYTAVIYPVMSKQYNSEASLLGASFEKSIKYLSFITIPICVCCLIYSGDIIDFIYGSQYDQAGSVLKILIWTVCFLFINGAASTALNASHKEVSITKIYFVAAVFNITLNFFLIPQYSYIGAAVSTVLSEILVFALALYSLKGVGIVPSRHLTFDCIKIIVSSCILGVILFVLDLNMWVAIPVGIVIYLILLYVTRAFDDGDIYIIKEIIGR
ncbi:MAG: flippase [Methanobrevibacter sp.]|nr:flippase [Methanobrevibacter sp.]